MQADITCPVSTGPGRDHLAYHEAGHVVVGELLGLDLLDTDILPDNEGGRGHTHFARPAGWLDPAPGQVVGAERDFIERVLTTFMAGVAAEARSGHSDPDGAGWDLDESVRDWARLLAGTPEQRAALVERHLKRAASMLERPAVWRAVESVAGALLEQGRVDGRAAVQLVRDAVPIRP